MASTPPNAPPPAYAEAPRRHGLLYAIVGIGALVAVVVLVVFMLGGGRGSAPSSPGTGPVAGVGDARKSLDAAKAALDQASKDVLQPPASSLPPPSAAPVPAPVEARPGATPPPSDAAPPPRVAVPAEPQRPVARPAPGVTPPPKVASTPATAPAPAPAPTIIPAPAAPPPAQLASADRWSQMRDEMERCSSTSVIPRIQCQQRIRARFCDGYWGTVPDCPTGNRRS